MGCGGGKAVAAGQVHSAGKGAKEALPPLLAAATAGRFQSQLPPKSEGHRDFARIFFADERKIYVFAPGMPSMRPLQPTTGPSSAHIGDMSEQVVNMAVSLFSESLQMHLRQALGSSAPDSDVQEILVSRAIASMTVNIAIDFALHMKLLPMFLQPAFLILVMGKPLQARAVSYGFVAERPQQICGDRPESKRTPFCVRLMSPNLLTATADEDLCKNWEVEYSAMEVFTSTITQAVEMDMPKIREAINTSTWDPLLR